MAEGLFNTLIPQSLRPFVNVRSAGTQGLHGNQAQPFAIQAVAEYGVDISGHRARLIDAQMVRSADLVLAMENHHLYSMNRLLIFRCKYAYLLGSYAPKRPNLEIEDPYGLPLNAYATCAGEIVDCFPVLVDEIESLMESRTS